MIRCTRPVASNAARPVRPVPALLATTVRSRAPCSMTASHKASGSPAPPKPAHKTTAPSGIPATASARLRTRLSIIVRPARSEGDPIAALEREHRPGFVRRGDLERQVLDNRPDGADLIGIARGKLAAADPQRILEPDPDIAAHDRAHRYQRQLVAARCEDRPGIGIAKELVGDPLHVDEVLRIRTDTAEDPKYSLNKKRRLNHATVEKMREIIEMADIVAFELEAGAATLPQILQDPLDVDKGVAENKIARHP